MFVAGVSTDAAIGTPRSLQLFRWAIGASLCAWFVTQALQSATAAAPMIDPRVTATEGLSGLCATCLLSLPARALWLGWAAAACAITLGLGARLVAILAWYTIYQWLTAVHPEASFEERVVMLFLLWSWLLPLGHRSRPQNELPLRLFMLTISFVYFNVSFWSRYWPAWPDSLALRLATVAVPALYLFPHRSWPRRAGAALQLGLHSWLALHAGSFCVNALLAATALIYLREDIDARLPAPATATRRAPLDAVAVLALCLTLLSGIALVAQFSGRRSTIITAARAFHVMSLDPAHLAFYPPRDASAGVAHEQPAPAARESEEPSRYFPR
jgi:hypothetical protein